MQLTPLLTALLIALPTALALPTTEDSTSPALSTTDESIFNNTTPLEKRANYGWLSSYAPGDRACKGGWGGDRPKIKGNGCVTFKPISPIVGIHHGSWPLSFGSLDVFIDAHCQSKIHTISPPANGDKQCVDTRETGMWWGSVKPQ